MDRSAHRMPRFVGFLRACGFGLLVLVASGPAAAQQRTGNTSDDNIVTAALRQVVIDLLKSVARDAMQQGWAAFTDQACRDPAFRERYVDAPIRSYFPSVEKQRLWLRLAHVSVLQCRVPIDESSTRVAPGNPSPPPPPAESARPKEPIDRNQPVYWLLAAADASARGDVPGVKAQLDRLDAQPKPERANRAASREENEAGLASYRAGALDEAAGHFHRAVELDPGYQEALNNWAFMLMESGHGNEALPVLVQTLTMAPFRASAWMNMGQMLADTQYQKLAVGCILIADRYSTSRPTLRASLEKESADPRRSANRRAAMQKALDVIDGQVALPL